MTMTECSRNGQIGYLAYELLDGKLIRTEAVKGLRIKQQSSIKTALLIVAECRIAREVFKQNLTGFFVLITDETEPQQIANKRILTIILSSNQGGYYECHKFEYQNR